MDTMMPDDATDRIIEDFRRRLDRLAGEVLVLKGAVAALVGKGEISAVQLKDSLNEAAKHHVGAGDLLHGQNIADYLIESIGQ